MEWTNEENERMPGEEEKWEEEKEEEEEEEEENKRTKRRRRRRRGQDCGHGVLRVLPAIIISIYWNNKSNI